VYWTLECNKLPSWNRTCELITIYIYLNIVLKLFILLIIPWFLRWLRFFTHCLFSSAYWDWCTCSSQALYYATELILWWRSGIDSQELYNYNHHHHNHFTLDNPLWSMAFIRSQSLVISSLDFLTTGFLQGGLSTPRPTPNLEDQASVFVTPETGWTSYAPRHWVTILVAFYDTHELRWDSSYPPVTTRKTQLYTAEIRKYSSTEKHLNTEIQR
jgi:hypothetical protein